MIPTNIEDYNLLLYENKKKMQKRVKHKFDSVNVITVQFIL